MGQIFRYNRAFVVLYACKQFFLKNQILTPQRLDRNILGKPPLRRTPAPQQPTDTDTLIPLPLAPDPQI
jgi:hypothetical protein